MSKETYLFGKTFDQQVDAAGGNLAGKDVRPNTLIRGEVVFEPVLNGIRVTARDEQHRLMWGFIASKGILNQVHCPVAIYDTLQSLIAEQMKKHSLPSIEEADPIVSAKAALDNLQDTISGLRQSITVKNVSQATRERAATIKRLASDATRIIQLESL